MSSVKFDSVKDESGNEIAFVKQGSGEEELYGSVEEFIEKNEDVFQNPIQEEDGEDRF